MASIFDESLYLKSKTNKACKSYSASQEISEGVFHQSPPDTLSKAVSLAHTSVNCPSFWLRLITVPQTCFNFRQEQKESGYKVFL